MQIGKVTTENINLNSILKVSSKKLEEFCIDILSDLNFKINKEVDFTQILMEAASRYSFLATLHLSLASNVRYMKIVGTTPSILAQAMGKRDAVEETMKAIKLYWESVSRSYTVLSER